MNGCRGGFVVVPHTLRLMNHPWDIAHGFDPNVEVEVNFSVWFAGLLSMILERTVVSSQGLLDTHWSHHSRAS